MMHMISNMSDDLINPKYNAIIFGSLFFEWIDSSNIKLLK